MTENDTNICKCLFETLFEWDDDCIFVPERQEGDEEPLYIGYDQNPSFEFREELNQLDNAEDFIPDYLVLYNNNKVNWVSEPHYEVYRIIADNYIFDMTIFRKWEIIVYTNGISGIRGNFIAMRGREVIMEQNCPISYSDLREYFRNNREFEKYKEISDKITELKRIYNAK